MEGRSIKEMNNKNLWVWKYKKRRQKMLRLARKKEDSMSDKSYIPTIGIYYELPLLLTLQMNQSFSVMFQLWKTICRGL